MRHIGFGLLVLAIAIAVTACAGTPAPTPASQPKAAAAPTIAAAGKLDPAAVQMRYNTMAFNVNELGKMIDKWNAGKDDARTEASERVERAEQLANFAWPSEMMIGVKGLQTALGDMDKTIQAKDKTAAVKAYGATEKAFDEVAHPFFGKWMPAMMSGGKMMNDESSVQGTFLGMSFTLDRMGEMMMKWSKGDDAARAEMGEGVERLEAMMNYVTWPSDMSKGMGAFKTSLSGMNQATRAKDVRATQSALDNLKSSFDEVAHPYYEKYMKGMGMGMGGDSSIQAAFLDLALNTTGLEESLDAWKDGSDDARKESSEKLERFDVLFQTKWPDSLTKAVTSFTSALAPVRAAVTAKEAAGATKAFTEAEAKFDDVAHAYYKWLGGGK